MTTVRIPYFLPTPHVDWLTLSPELSMLGAAAVCLMLAVLVPRPWRRPLSAFFAFNTSVSEANPLASSIPLRLCVKHFPS